MSLQPTFETVSSEIEQSEIAEESKEKALDAIAFIQVLHDLFQSNGMSANDEPDLNELENLIDALNGELAAACLFLSEKSFDKVPTMLRTVADNLETQDTAKDVPVVVVRGFRRLASRIENTKAAQMRRLTEETQKVP